MVRRWTRGRHTKIVRQPRRATVTLRVMAHWKLWLAVVLFAAAAFAQQITPSAPVPKPPGPLQEFSSSLEALSRTVSRSVVQIFTTGYAAPDEGEAFNTSQLSRQHGSGSGVILSTDGHIVTNAHVVQGARRIQVLLRPTRAQTAGKRSLLKPPGQTIEAKIVGVDRESDLAVIKIERTGLPALTLGNSDNLRQGQVVLAFGNPLGLENSVSMGIVSSAARQIKPEDPMVYVQTDAPINPGNSGGPLVDTHGRVVGINTFILSQSGGSEGIGFSVPSNIVRDVVAQLRKSGHVHRGHIGVYAQTLTPSLAAGLGIERDEGVVLGDVTPEGPGEKAGLKVGDLVVSLDGKPIENARQLDVNLYRRPMGEKVRLQVLRGAEKLELQVEVIERRDDPNRFADMVDPEKNLVPKLGILGVEIDRKVAGMFPGLRRQYGVVVAARSGNSPYTGNGLQPGDVIYMLNGSPTASVEILRSTLDQLAPGSPLVMQVERGGRLMFLTVELE